MAENETKVVSFATGAPAGEAGEPQPNVIEFLEHVLEQAKAGNVIAVGIVALGPHERAIIDSVGDAYMIRLIGGAGVLHHELLTAYERSQGH